MAGFDENSEEMRRINRERWEKYVQLATADYIRKISELSSFSSDRGAFHLDNSFHGIPAPNHIIYKLGEPLMSADGKHGYEFVVEYDRYDPNVGIYYGAKALIFDTENAEAQIDAINSEWEQVRSAVMLALSNVYPECHFNQIQRYKLTDNANNFTYWPFWIVLYENEPIAVAGHAVTIIRKLYEQLFAGNCPDCQLSERTPQHHIEAAFTDAAYARFVNSMIGKSTNRADEITAKVNTFMEQMLSRQIIERDEIFEHAYCLKNIEMTDFAFLMVEFVTSLSPKESKDEDDSKKGKNSDKSSEHRIPWQSIVDIFLSANKRRMDNLKRLYGAPVGATRSKTWNQAKALLKSLLSQN
jgi:hypothetical protein